MKKYMKKYLLLVLVLVMILTVFSGCGTTPTTTPTTSATGGETTSIEPTTLSTEEQVTLSIWLYSTVNDYYSSFNDNPVVQYLNKHFNVVLDFQQPAAGTEQEQLSLMFGSGQYADMIETSYYTGSLNSLFEDGVIIDLKEKIDSSMPNLKALIDADDDFRKTIINDDGQMLKLLKISATDAMAWGGLVYRKDILETMTGGNIAFPSGKEAPTTVADWEYMLSLYKMYFEAAGMPEFAPLIIPAVGYFVTGELVSGFGTAASFYRDGDIVKFGPVEDNFYNYLVKMKEWYDAGYIYKDFASRTNDPFYLPNTSLTYGAAAGIWYGLASQLGDVMSMPQYNLMVDVQPMATPLDAAQGVTSSTTRMSFSRYGGAGGYVVSSTCKQVDRLLQVMDYLYAEENAALNGIGLTAEQVAASNNQLYIKNGLQDGAYSLDASGKILINDLLNTGGALASVKEVFMNNRLPGLENVNADNQIVDENIEAGDLIWKTYEDVGNLPRALSRTSAEDTLYADKFTTINDYINTMVPSFITGTQPLDASSWQAFVSQLKAYGIDDLIKIYQDSYERYQNR